MGAATIIVVLAEVSIMKIRSVLGVLLVGGMAGAASAEVIVVDDQVMLRESGTQRPPRGMAMDAVEQRFGAPVSKHAAVGAPPITRWDYNGFSVFFEYDKVIHAVAIGG
jgi:hypothetical protein